MIRICKHPKFTAWSMNRVTRVWRRDCLTCGYFETYTL